MRGLKMWRHFRARQRHPVTIVALVAFAVVVAALMFKYVAMPLLRDAAIAILKSSEGIAGTSMYIGDEFVIIDNGYNGDEITWIVVLNWPASSTPSERRNDDRFDSMAIPPKAIMADGSHQPILSTPHVYFYDGRAVTIFPVNMTEDDLAELHGHFSGMTDYRQMLSLLRRYEVRLP
jgi:hypothetical protein